MVDYLRAFANGIFDKPIIVFLYTNASNFDGTSADLTAKYTYIQGSTNEGTFSLLVLHLTLCRRVPFGEERTSSRYTISEYPGNKLLMFFYHGTGLTQDATNCRNTAMTDLSVYRNILYHGV